MPVQQKGWVKFHRQALRTESSLMKLDKNAQLAFIKYVMLARWQKPYCGCLCDPDGTPWSRERRAVLLQVGYSTAQRAETAMMDAELIIIDKRGKTSHHDSQGRLRILNYSTFQQPSEMEASDSADDAQPSKVEASASQDGGCQPSKVEASTSDNSASQDGGLEAGAPTGTGANGEDTLEETASQDGGLDLQEVRRKKTSISKASKGLAAGAAGSENSPTLFPDDTPEPPPPEEPPSRPPTDLTGPYALALIEQYPKETDAQIILRECWEAFGFDGAPRGKQYSRAADLVCDHGYPKVQEWAEKVRNEQQKMPAGAKPMAWFTKELKERMADWWKWNKNSTAAGTHSGQPAPYGRGVAEVADFSKAQTGEVDTDELMRRSRQR